MKLRICFEIDGLVEDEHGNPAPAGLAVFLGETERPFDYQALTESTSIENVLKLVCLDNIVKLEDVKIITPEEYDEKYGDDEEAPVERHVSDAAGRGRR